MNKINVLSVTKLSAFSQCKLNTINVKSESQINYSFTQNSQHEIGRDKGQVPYHYTVTLDTTRHIARTGTADSSICSLSFYQLILIASCNLGINSLPENGHSKHKHALDYVAQHV